MLININEIPKDLLNKIPLSIRLTLENNILDTKKLPFEIEYEFRNFNYQESTIPYVDKKTIDIKPNFSVYTDFETITDKSMAVFEYMKNYLLIGKGEYPFDPTFGNDLKKFINITEANTRDTLLREELKNIKTVAESVFSIPINIKNFNVKRIDLGTSIAYALDLFIVVGEISDRITVINTREEFELTPALSFN
jgi:hypothetical protein